jgi:hypothetical protein
VVVSGEGYGKGRGEGPLVGGFGRNLRGGGLLAFLGGVSGMDVGLGWNPAFESRVRT